MGDGRGDRVRAVPQHRAGHDLHLRHLPHHARRRQDQPHGHGMRHTHHGE